MPQTVRFHQLGDAQVLTLEPVKDRPLSAAELRIKVEAIGVNRSDIQFRRGEYIEPAKFPAQLGYEAAGVVEAVGREDSGFRVGDRVSVLPAFSLNQYGTYGETAILPIHAVTRHPPKLDAVSAAGLWMGYLTAYGGLIERGGVEGKWVLITAATGGVGSAAIQVALAAGARVIATTRNKDKVEKLSANGRIHVINTSHDDLAAAVKTITDGHGADFIFDPIAGPTMQSLADAAAEDGVVTLYGYFGGIPAALPLIPLLLKGLTIRSFSVFRLTADAERLRRAQRYITEGVERGILAPAIDRSFDLADVARAHQYVEGNQQSGKVVLSVR